VLKIRGISWYLAGEGSRVQPHGERADESDCALGGCISDEAATTIRPSQALERLDGVVVRVTTWAAAAFLVILLIGSASTGDTSLLWRAANPAVTAAVGLWMLIRRRPRAIVQLLSAGSVVILYTGLIDTSSRPGALLGVVSMGIVGALLVRTHGVRYLVAIGVVIAIVSMWWHEGGGTLAERAPDASIPTLLFAFTGSLLVWLKRALVQESAAYHDVANALSTSEERFRLGFEMAAAGVAFISTADHAFVRVNHATCVLLGYEEQELVGRTFESLIHPDDRLDALERIGRLIDGETDYERAAIRYVRRDGAIAHALTSSAIVADTHGGPRHIIAHAVDITDQIVAERRMLDLLASKDQLIASVSHELRTPLTGVVGYAELLREQVSDRVDSEALAMLDHIVGQGNDLTNIVEDLLVAARADIDALHVLTEVVDLGHEVAEVLTILSRHAPIDHVQVSGPSPTAIADPARVRQIVRNLVTNASRYGGDVVSVEFDTLHPWSRIRVSDNGPGVPVAQREQIFDAYHRAHDEPGLTASVGLGLTVARTLARLMGGDLVYRYEDEVSIFELRLPAAVPAHSDSRQAAAPQLETH